MSFLFINKTLRLNNLKTRIAMNAKISVFVICIGYYIICMTVLLINVTKLLLLEKPCMFNIKKWQSRKQNEGDSNFRNSPSVVFLGKSALKKCSKFPGEHPCSDFKWEQIFLSGFSSQTLAIHRTAGEGRVPSFIPLYHFHPFTNIQTFICNFACEMTITYF